MVRFTPAKEVVLPCIMPRIIEKQNPADQVVEHGGRHDYRAHFAAQQVQVHQDFRDHRQSGNRECCADEEREDPEIAPGARRQRKWETNAAPKPKANGMITPSELTRIALRPWRKMLRRSISRPAVSRKSTTPSVVTVSITIGKISGGRKNRSVKLRAKMAEYRGPQQNAGHNLAQHRRLIQLAHELARRSSPNRGGRRAQET